MNFDYVGRFNKIRTTRTDNGPSVRLATTVFLIVHASNSVLGGGTNGICTGLALAKRKLNVAVVEQFSRDHQRGSSHGHSRITRYLVD